MPPLALRLKYLAPLFAAVLLVTGCGLKPAKSFKLSAEQAKQQGLPELSFHFSYPDSFGRSRPQLALGKTYLSLKAESGSGRLRELVEAAFLDTGGRKRDSAAYLPLLMEQWKQDLEESFPRYRLTQEGLTKVGNGLRAYQLFFSAESLPGAKASESIKGRLVLIPRPGLTGGVALILIAGPAAGLDRTTQLGAKGLSKQVIDSFRFGA